MVLLTSQKHGGGNEAVTVDIEGKKMNYIRKTINNYRNERRLLSSSSPGFLFLAVPLSFGAVFVRPLRC